MKIQREPSLGTRFHEHGGASTCGSAPRGDTALGASPRGAPHLCIPLSHAMPPACAPQDPSAAADMTVQGGCMGEALGCGRGSRAPMLPRLDWAQAAPLPRSAARVMRPHRLLGQAGPRVQDVEQALLRAAGAVAGVLKGAWPENQGGGEYRGVGGRPGRRLTMHAPCACSMCVL